MMRALTGEAKAKLPRLKFPGIVTVARGAGVHYTHMFRVLMGERKSPRLVRAYRAHLASKGVTPPDYVPSVD